MSTNHILGTEERLSNSSHYALRDAACKVVESMLDGTCGELPFGKAGVVAAIDCNYTIISLD